MAHQFKIGSKVRCINADPGSFLQNGNIYTVAKSLGSDNYVYLEEAQRNYNYCPSRFEAAQLSLEDELILAKSVIGKTVKWGSNRVKVDSVILFIKGVANKETSTLVDVVLEDEDFCVAIKSGLSTIPMREVEVTESFVVKNVCDYYTEVFKDYVQVGCQKISKEKVEEIAAKLKELN